MQRTDEFNNICPCCKSPLNGAHFCVSCAQGIEKKKFPRRRKKTTAFILGTLAVLFSGIALYAFYPTRNGIEVVRSDITSSVSENFSATSSILTSKEQSVVSIPIKSPVSLLPHSSPPEPSPALATPDEITAQLMLKLGDTVSYEPDETRLFEYEEFTVEPIFTSEEVAGQLAKKIKEKRGYKAAWCPLKLYWHIKADGPVPSVKKAYTLRVYMDYPAVTGKVEGIDSEELIKSTYHAISNKIAADTAAASKNIKYGVAHTRILPNYTKEDMEKRLRDNIFEYLNYGYSAKKIKLFYGGIITEDDFNTHIFFFYFSD